MKKFFLGLLLTVLSVVGYSQTTTHKDWTVVNEGEWSSFYWGVTRTQQADNYGRYFYYIYFYSNSYFSTKRDGYNYDRASTYVRGIHLKMKEYKKDYYGKLQYYNTVTLDIPYYTCDWVYLENYYVAYFWSYQPYNKFYLTFDKVSAFDYSIY